MFSVLRAFGVVDEGNPNGIPLRYLVCETRDPVPTPMLTG